MNVPDGSYHLNYLDFSDILKVLDLSDVGEVLRWPVSINIPASLANGLEGETLALDLDDDTDDKDEDDIVSKNTLHQLQFNALGS